MRTVAVDFLIPGEGELGLAALVEHLGGARSIADVPNLMYREGGEVRANPRAPFLEDLDALPFPAHDLIDLEAYFRISRPGYLFARKRYAALMTSRGCPFGCTYCHNIHGRKNRARSAGSVLAEMEKLQRDHAIEEFVILDDLFNLDAERLRAIAEGIIARKWDVALNVPTGLRGDLMTEDGIRLLKRAGMFRCMFAIDTASPRLQKLIGRRLDVAKTLRMIAVARAEGLLVHGTFIVGFPGETEEETRLTIETAVRSQLHTAAFHRALPFRGTRMFEQARDMGADVDEWRDADYRLKNTGINPSSVPDETLVRLRRRAYRRFYASPRRVASFLWRLPNKRRVMPHLLRMWVERAWVG
jgi:radical SAM superfamily enzyme YgiQ (UPF0313 family)